MSRRRLSDEERALWKGVTRSIKPLRAPVADKSEEPAPPEAKRRVSSSAVTVNPNALFGRGATSAIPPPPPPPLAPLGRRLKKRVSSRSLDERIDLHGMTQSEAHHALFAFLRGAQARGASIALVITGKGSSDASGERGVLRRQVPQWLRLPEFRSLIVGFDGAGRSHGGEGALYVRLRKRRGG